ncbi:MULTISPECIES: hypothetical protein [unclassified Stenotrophomonas]|uniref:hypothetical protein n=1 Tax=unclassified Stenotrophomonas TaxID=196198 RepID=UPI0034663C87
MTTDKTPATLAVDVLAFFDDLAHYLSGQEDLAGYEIEQTEAAREAVAELIGAVDRLTDSASSMNNGWDEAIAALARVKGESA